MYYQLDPTVSMCADWLIGIVTLLIAPVLWFECLNFWKQLKSLPVRMAGKRYYRKRG